MRMCSSIPLVMLDRVGVSLSIFGKKESKTFTNINEQKSSVMCVGEWKKVSSRLARGHFWDICRNVCSAGLLLSTCWRGGSRWTICWSVKVSALMDSPPLPPLTLLKSSSSLFFLHTHNNPAAQPPISPWIAHRLLQQRPGHILL